MKKKCPYCDNENMKYTVSKSIYNETESGCFECGQCGRLVFTPIDRFDTEEVSKNKTYIALLEFAIISFKGGV